jgi:hypothetical protein
LPTEKSRQGAARAPTNALLTDDSAGATGALLLSILGQSLRIEYDNAAVLGPCLAANFGAMRVESLRTCSSFAYTIRTLDDSFLIERTDTMAQVAAVGVGDLLYYLEKDVTVEIQQRRPDLLFLHAAAVEWHGIAVVLAADSGSGKSTTTWALMHHGFRYLSDELAAIDPHTLEVSAYPHALCLKQPPPSPYVLPAATMHLGRTHHVPVTALPGALAKSPLPLGAVFLIRHVPERKVPRLRRLRVAEASTRLYVTALNALAHSNRGLDAVLRISESVPCFALETAELAESCAVLLSAIEQRTSAHP